MGKTLTEVPKEKSRYIPAGKWFGVSAWDAVCYLPISGIIKLRKLLWEIKRFLGNIKRPILYSLKVLKNYDIIFKIYSFKKDLDTFRGSTAKRSRVIYASGASNVGKLCPITECPL